MKIKNPNTKTAIITVKNTLKIILPNRLSLTAKAVMIGLAKL